MLLSQACRQLTHDTLLGLSQYRRELGQGIRDVISTLGLPRRGCRAGAHCRRRSEAARRVTSSVRRPSQARGTPTVCGNRNAYVLPLPLKAKPIPVVASSRQHRQASSTSSWRQRVLVDVVLSPATQRRPSGAMTRRGLLPSPVPSLYVLNAAAITKSHAVRHLASDLTRYKVDVAVITETHLKKKHADHRFAVSGYTLFRRDRVGRRGGGVAVYVNSQLPADVWTCPGDSAVYELLWVCVKVVCRPFLVGALYHPPKPLYQPSALLDYVETSIDALTNTFPSATIILAGDFNSLDDSEILSRNALVSIVNRPTRGENHLDRIYVSDLVYTNVGVVTSTVKSNHKAIVAYTGPPLKPPNESRERRVFKSRSPTQHALFLKHESQLNIFRPGV